MKILIINSWSHTGSTGKITYGLYNYLRKSGHDVLLCVRGTGEEQPYDKNIICLDSFIEHKLAVIGTRFTGYEGVFNGRATKKLITIINSFKPDIIQLFNLHAYYINSFKLLDYLKYQHYPILYTMFDEFAYMGRCCFSLGCEQFMTECKKCPTLKNYPRSLLFDRSSYAFKRKLKLYNNFNHLHFASVKWCCERARKSKLLGNRDIIELDNPINYDDVFYPRDSNIGKRKLGIPLENKVILAVAVASIPSKGGKYFIDLANKFIEDTTISFVYIGYNINSWTIPHNVVTLGFVSDQNEMAEYYSMADLFVCTSLADLTPNACLDALGCGTPQAGFSEGGVPYCTSEEFGTYVKTFDIDALADVVRLTPKKTEQRIKAIREYAYNRYSGNVIYPKILNIYNRLMKI